MKRRWTAPLAIFFLVMYCGFCGWVFFEAHRSMIKMSLADSPPDDDLRHIMSDTINAAEYWMFLVGFLSFFAGIAVMSIYQAVKAFGITGNKPRNLDPANLTADN
jgi:hypothetical protein